MSRGQSDRGKDLPPSLSDRVDEACDRLEAAYLAGGRPRIEDYLPQAAGLERAAFFRELIQIDLAYRRGRGEVPRARDYLDRFPGCDSLIVAATGGGMEAPVAQSGVQLPDAARCAAADEGAKARGRTRLTLTVSEGPHQGRVFTFEDRDYFIVGRGKTAHFQLSRKDGYFSRNHFLIEFSPPHCRLLDLGSTNGTFVNGEKVGKADLRDGAVIRGGETAIGVTIENLEEPAAEDATRTHHRFPDLEIEPPLSLRAPSGPPEGFPAVLPSVSGTVPRPEPDAVVCLACSAPFAPFHDDDRVVADGMPPADLCRVCGDRFRGNPQPIDGFGLLKKLGRGGMGIVYLAARLTDGALVALKVLIKDGAATSRDVAQFLREAQILRQLQHPHITRFLDLNKSRGRLYLVMEYVPGIDAGRRLKQGRAALSDKRAVDWACQCLEALQYAHDLGFVHRDIKPSNILVADARGQDLVKLADFGLARVYEASHLSGLTISGDLAGTPPFLPPEQITHYREARPAGDLYAIGATLYHLLTGVFAYDFPARQELRILKILQENPVPIASRRPDLPPGLAAIIGRSLERNPADRFPDARAMRVALEPFR
jgi:serine/threonine-protein kinase